VEAFYDKLSGGDVETLDRLARLLLELRDSRARLLASHGVEDEQQLLDRIASGALAEHPAYEDYLGARSIGVLREAIRTDLKTYMQGIRLP
jgi:ABC-type Na+ transport system ATPase subunit NatA